MTPLTIQIFVAPLVSCGTGPTWQTAVGFLEERLKHRFGDAISVESIEMFAPRSFEFSDVLQALEQGGALPIVRVGNEIVSQGAKLSESRIARAIACNLERIRKSGDERNADNTTGNSGADFEPDGDQSGPRLGVRHRRL